ncbi:YajG family lipoprotein [Aliidiomarina sanyensis]|uniref:Lipoprotein n=1 Tax=Aliidiomarina sanyensis TaxID=1249555 RepID=A0A432WNL8_9GAMM|nr:YajG family lipoprotein [Aliidiomarina sanyensis]RUO35374.1 hypothetical protein CWE11_05005 [Aliidiomarina sanyensis]
MSNAFPVIRTIVFTLPLLALSACSSTPVSTPSALAVTVNTPTLLSEGQVELRPIQLTVLDRRTHNHILRVEHSLDNAEFATSQTPVATLISEELQRGLSVVGQAQTQLTLVIEEALIRAVRRGNEYEVNHSVVLSAHGVRGNTQVEVEMTTRMGPQSFRRLDHARLERDFNRNLNATLNALMQEPELKQFLQVGTP